MMLREAECRVGLTEKLARYVRERRDSVPVTRTRAIRR